MKLLFEPPPKTGVSSLDIWAQKMFQSLNRLEAMINANEKFYDRSNFTSIPTADKPVLFDSAGDLPGGSIDHSTLKKREITLCAHTTSKTDVVVGRSTTGAGNVEEITCTSAGRDLIDDVDASAQRTTLGLGNSATRDVGVIAGTVSAGNHLHSGVYAPIGSGVTNGDAHDHSGGDGAQIAHTSLSGIGTNTHAQIDDHLAASAPHTAHPYFTVKQTTGHPGSPIDGQIEINETDNKVYIYADADWRQLATW